MITAVVVMPLAQQLGGGELMFQQLLEFGRDLGITWIAVFLENGPMVEHSRQMGIETHCIQAGRLRQIDRLVNTQRSIARIAKRTGADTIIGWMGKGHLYSGPAAMIAGLPAIWYQLGIPKTSERLDLMAHFLPARGIIAVSGTTAKAEEKLWPARKMITVHPGVDLSRFEPSNRTTSAQLRKDLGLPAEGPVIGIVGRLQRWKGMHVVLESMPAVLKAHADAFCVIVGGRHELESDYAELLNQQVRALALEPHVKLTGLQRNIPEWMQAMDVIIHASDCEPFGIVIVEAMALGKPVIAGASGGPTEIITDGIDGLLVPFEDSVKLAEAIIAYLDDAQLRIRLGGAGQSRAQHFSVQRYAREFVEAVKELLHTQN